MLNQKEVIKMLTDHYKDYSMMHVKHCQIKAQDTNVTVCK